MQTWRKPFTDLAIVWMEVLIRQVHEWTLEAINADQVFDLKLDFPYIWWVDTNFIDEGIEHNYCTNAAYITF